MRPARILRYAMDTKHASKRFGVNRPRAGVLGRALGNIEHHWLTQNCFGGLRLGGGIQDEGRGFDEGQRNIATLERQEMSAKRGGDGYHIQLPPDLSRRGLHLCAVRDE